MNCVVAISTAPVNSITTKQEPNWRLLSRRRSMTGFFRVSSHGIMAQNETTVRTPKTFIRVEVPNQSLRWPSSRTTSREPRKVATSRKPTRSKRTPFFRRSRRSRLAASLSSISQYISPSAISPIGPLIRKHQCQEALSESQPPSVGPITGATTMATP
ncbi:hypothetical protein NBEOAGPD_2105 [Methylobacterium gregans]|uniref:Uncharacterized protein n=1 Tax=Methylobacterium gregans TaxID=374424 RepID=A0AA37MAH5_9HYPH|nr:hypothetical protein NBEOAGPD_2105 [Methylobacterium gregans]